MPLKIKGQNFLDINETAEYLQCSVSLLRKYRLERTEGFPKPMKFARRLYWSQEAIDEHILGIAKGENDGKHSNKPAED